jgi:hypothetical protein
MTACLLTQSSLLPWLVPYHRTLAMIKPDAYRHMGKILHAIYKSGFIVKSVRGPAWVVAWFYSTRGTAEHTATAAVTCRLPVMLNCARLLPFTFPGVPLGALLAAAS